MTTRLTSNDQHTAPSRRTALTTLAAGALAAGALMCTTSTAFAQPPPDGDNPIPPNYTQTDAEPPPPGYGPPPPGRRGPPPPGYGHPDPYNYGVPPGTPPAFDPDDWEEGDPIPPGYRTDTRIRKGLVIGGSVTLGTLWLISVVVGAAATDIESANESSNITGTTKEDFYPLFVPVVGPFITIGTTGSSGVGTAFLLIDGIGQAGGLAMLIAGIAAKQTYLRPAPQYGEVNVEFTPIVSPGFQGMGLKGTF